ncbi:MAG: hypothetical protein IJA11_03355 [Oscillospiraceae bacterium]|nr:hypothetical protein [Oscillospiraceae bacterium]
MAEFCFDCWNKLMGEDYPAAHYILSDELDLCEGCGEWKPVIVRLKRRYMLFDWLKWRFGRE